MKKMGKFPRPHLCPAYLIRWMDDDGNIVGWQTASEYPVTQLFKPDAPKQHMAAMALGRDFQAAHDNLLDMLDRADPKFGALVRKLCKLGG